MDTFIAWCSAHTDALLGFFLGLSEIAGAICQILWPSNKGITGALATVVKITQKLKKPKSKKRQKR